MLGSAETILTILIALASWLTAPAEAASRPAAQPGRAGVYVRTWGDRFQIVTGRDARDTFFRGVNLGAGAPGHFPGEFAFTKEDYRRYIRHARDLHANAIRVYALHPPAFYQALREENQAHPNRPIWLFQEVWTELPETNDFWDASFTRGFEQEIRFAVDALHGSALIGPRPGHASGRYDADVSSWIAGWILGREWEPYAVRVTQGRHPDSTRYRGTYFIVEDGTAMETWLARACDGAVSYEASRYGAAHAVSFVNWPTLDVMRHPTETERGGREAEHDEDAYSVDPARIRPLVATGPETRFYGYFANYHIYPYYPDFMNLDPGYSATKDRHGTCNYAGYLRDLKAHTRGLPLLIGEFGVPSSRGIAHLQPQGIHHGGASEIEQGERDTRLIEDIHDAGCAGSLLFALFDEWFKVNWMVWQMETPRERDPLWHNLLDPEENYGLIAFDPPPRIRVDGSVSDWSGVAAYAESAPVGSGTSPQSIGAPLRALYATSDQARLYLRLDLEPEALRGRVAAFGVAIDMLDPKRGDTGLPAPLDATWSRGAEYALVIEPGVGRGSDEGWAELFIDQRMSWSGWSRDLKGRSFVPHRAPLRPVSNRDGVYVPMLVETNRERVARDGTIFPARHLDSGRLARGREPAPGRSWAGGQAYSYDPHAEWYLDRARGVVEIAIPWGLLNVGDPSTRSVIDDRAGTPEVERTQTTGVAFLAWATSRKGFRADSLGPMRVGARRARPSECHFLGPAGTEQSTTGTHVTVRVPDRASLMWNGWEQPITKERVKASATFIRKAFEGMESRESEANGKLDAQR